MRAFQFYYILVNTCYHQNFCFIFILAIYEVQAYLSDIVGSVPDQHNKQMTGISFIFLVHIKVMFKNSGCGLAG